MATLQQTLIEGALSVAGDKITLDSDSNSPFLIKNASGEFHLRNLDDNNYIDIRVRNIFAEGSIYEGEAAIVQSNSDINVGNITAMGNMLPTDDITYDVGSVSKRWRDLHTSTAFLYSYLNIDGYVQSSAIETPSTPSSNKTRKFTRSNGSSPNKVVEIVELFESGIEVIVATAIV